MSLAARVRAAQAAGGPRFLDRRFDSDGNAVLCPGNTVIRHIRAPADLDRLCAAQERLKATPAGACFAWLPRASLHCTLFNGLLYADRDVAHWPSTLANDAPRAMADAFMLQAFRQAKPISQPVDMTIAGFSGTTSDALGVALSASDIDDPLLRAYRDALAQASGLTQRPGHADYRFHITLGYLIAWPKLGAAEDFDAQAQEIAQELATTPIVLPANTPEFCKFDCLDHFEVIESMA